METIRIQLLSTEPHISQILTGFQMLASQNRWKLQVEDRTSDPAMIHKSVMALVSYREKTLVYDTLDGYQHPETIAYHLDRCDYYFKRSFSAEKNRELGLHWEGKMFPLGLNYHVSCRNHPIDPPYWKETVKKYLGKDSNFYRNTWFSPRRFEDIPKTCKTPQVLFLTRLWHEDPGLSDLENRERREINAMRIQILRTLRSMEGKIHFVGGLPDTQIARDMAPELIMPPSLTDRKNYLRCLRKSDICIGTMGLHESIGWKTGEYVAGAKGIVNERLHYAVPGEFSAGKHYLEFETAEECLQAVEYLVEQPDALYKMRKANREYYLAYLRPDRMIQNTLSLVDNDL